MINRLRTWLLKLPRHKKRLIQVVADVVLVFLALWMAFVVRLGIDEMINPVKMHLWLFLAAPVVAIPLLFALVCIVLSCVILAMMHW